VRVLLVGLGGCIGSMLRFWLSGLVQQASGAPFPFGTLAVNVIGSLAIGALSQLADDHQALTPESHGLLVVGVLGGFTTFSAFANDTVNGMRAGLVPLAIANVLVSVATCLAAVWLGRAVMAWAWR
jgi:CrcB protein